MKVGGEEVGNYSGNSFHDIFLEMCMEQREQQESQ